MKSSGQHLNLKLCTPSRQISTKVNGFLFTSMKMATPTVPQVTVCGNREILMVEWKILAVFVDQRPKWCMMDSSVNKHGVTK